MPDPRKVSVGAPAGSDESGSFPEQDAMFNNLIARSITVLPSSPYSASATAGSINNELRVGLRGDGSDESGTINTAILAASGQGGGRVILTGGKTVGFASALSMRNSVWVDLAESTLQWIGPAGGSMSTSPVANPLMRARLTGGILDPTTAATGFGIDWHSPQGCVLDLELLAGASTFTGLRWAADATNASGYDGTRNAAYNYIPRLIGSTCGTAMRFTGQASGAVTDNRFDLLDFGGGGCSVVGMVCSSGGFNDTNSVGQARFKFGANNAIGVDMGENNASTNVYNWSFQNLACDDPTNALTGLTGIALRNSVKSTVANFYPQFTGGTPINFGIAASYFIRETFAGGGNLIYERKAGIVGMGGHLLQLPAFNANYTPNLDLGDYIAMTLTAAQNVNAPPAPTAGTNPEFVYQPIQGGAAGFATTYVGFKIGSSAPAMIIAAPGNASIDTFLWDNSFWRLKSRMTGY